MQSTLTIQAAVWLAAATALCALAVYRKIISRSEVDVIHLRQSETPLILGQEILAHRLASIDRWGKLLTIILIAYGVLLSCGYMFLAWKDSVQPVS